MSLNQSSLVERIVDGEADSEELQRLLAACEARPEGYRELALAFVERQRWSVALRDFAVSPVSSGFSWRERWPTALAACIGLTVGVTAMLMWSSSLFSPTVFSRSDRVVQGETAQQGSLASTVPVRSAGNERLESMVNGSLFPDRTLNALLEAGFEWEESPHVYLIDANDGSRWAVPTHEVTLRYRDR